MQAVVDIDFRELLKIVKNLPENKLSELKAEIDKDNSNPIDRNQLGNLLLNGPTFSKNQLAAISQTRKAINQWRIK